MFPIRSALLALLLVACSSEDEETYDLPIRPQAGQVSMEIGSDGSPLVLAQIAMNYATVSPQARRGPYQTRNYQCRIYRRGDTGWEAHSFRNLQTPDQGPSYLLRTWKGEVKPLVQDLHRYILYGQRGREWIAEKIARGDRFGGPFNHGNEFPLAATGDADWQYMLWDYPASAGRLPYLRVQRSDGNSILLDSLPQGMNDFEAPLMIPGERYDYLLGSKRAPPDSGQAFGYSLIGYRWSWDPERPGVRKRTLALSPSAYTGQAYTGYVEGELRTYVRVGVDSLAEFAVRADTLALLGYRVYPAGTDSLGTPVFKGYAPQQSGLDPKGCIHTLQVPPDEGSWAAKTYVHSSSCESGSDTLAPPPLPKGPVFDVRLIEMRFTPDGTPLVLFTASGFIDPNVAIPEEPLPSGIYCARRAAPGRWEWETIAEF